MDFGGKAHVLDAAEISFELWSDDDKYARKTSIVNCWRKSSILNGLNFENVNNVEDSSDNEADDITCCMKDLVSTLTDIKTMLSDRETEVSNMAPDNGFADVGLPEEFSELSDSNLVEIAENWHKRYCEFIY